MILARVAGGLLVTTTLACGLFRDCHALRLGDLGGPDPGALRTPDTVTVGQPFTATVTTFGSSTCTQPGRVDVFLNGPTATLIPYDYDDSCHACTSDAHPFPRSVVIQFSAAGPALVHLTGADGTLERAVVVRS